MSNIMKIRVGELVEFLNLNPDKPKLIIGPPGVGKTQIISEWAQSIGRKLYVLPLDHLSVDDFAGIPHIINGKLEIARPDIIPGENEEAVIFLDEITTVGKSMIAKAMMISNERRIGRFTFKKSYVVSAGNPPEWYGYKLDDRITTRFLIVEVTPTVEDFENYVFKHYDTQGAAWVIAYLKSFPDQLLPSKREGEVLDYPFPTPRAWEGVIRNFKGEYQKIDVAPAVGVAVASQFLAYIAKYSKLTIIEQVLESDDIKPYTASGIDECYAIAVMLANKTIKAVKINEEQFKRDYNKERKQVARAVTFLCKGLKLQNKNIPIEVLSIYVRLIMKKNIGILDIDKYVPMDVIRKIIEVKDALNNLK
jgi:hypothetical protein